MFSGRSHLESQPRRIIGLAALLGTLLGCQGISQNATVAQVRIIDASPDSTPIDAYEAGGAIAHNLAFGTITSYIPVSAGSTAISVNTSGSSQLLASSHANFLGTVQYTALIGNIAGSLQETILKDQNTPAPIGMVALRFVDQVTRVGPLDIYLQPPGVKFSTLKPVVVNAIFGSNSGYLNVPYGTYTLIIVPSGSSPLIPTSFTMAVFTGNQVSYPSGSVRTIVLLDQQLPTTPGLQVITATDFDPLSPA